MGNFYTDVIQQDPRFDQATPCHDLALLEPKFRSQVLDIISRAKTAGLDLRAVETFRSQALQEHYFNAGTTQLRNVGVHHYGLAADLVVFDDDGQPDWGRNYSFLGGFARQVGVIWGGDWGNPEMHHTFLDMDHVQRIRIEHQAKLFDGSWYPDDSYYAVPGIVARPTIPDQSKTPDKPIVKPAPAGISDPKVVAGIPAPTPSPDVEEAASAKLSGNEKIAFDVARKVNSEHFKHWFFLQNIMAFIEVESSFDFNAFRQEPSGVASYGCMQVLDITASGLGYKGQPEDMYDPTIGIWLGMAALCQNWNVFHAKAGDYPTMEEWVISYNEGVGNALDGKADDAYWNKWSDAQQKWRDTLGNI